MLGPRGRRRKRRFGRGRGGAGAPRRGGRRDDAASARLDAGTPMPPPWERAVWEPVAWEPGPPPEPASAPPSVPPLPPGAAVTTSVAPAPPSAAAEPPAVGQPLRPTGSSRLQKRRDRSRRRRISGVALLTGLGLVAAVLAGLLVNRAVTGDGEPEPVGRTQRTMLVQVRANDGLAKAAVLVAHDPATGRASMIFIPPGVLALAPGLGTVPFEQALQLRGAAASRGAVSELLGVTVDHDWTFSEAAFVGLIDRLGGVRVDVDVDVIAPAGGGRRVLLVSPGTGQDLDGAQALAFATYIAPGEDQLGALPRMQEVLEGILDKVDSAAALTPLLQAISRGAPGTMAPSGLADFVAAVAADRRADRISYSSLPVVPIESGAQRLRYRLDEVPALEIVNRDLKASVPEGRFSGDKRVIIQNGVGTPGITTTAQQRLSAAGFDIVKTGNANRFTYARSVILVRDATAASTQLGNEVARVLGLSPATVRVNPQRNTVTDVIVILGRDYKK